jgi:hypothetical protein
MLIVQWKHADSKGLEDLRVGPDRGVRRPSDPLHRRHVPKRTRSLSPPWRSWGAALHLPLTTSCVRLILPSQRTDGGYAIKRAEGRLRAEEPWGPSPGIRLSSTKRLSASKWPIGSSRTPVTGQRARWEPTPIACFRSRTRCSCQLLPGNRKAVWKARARGGLSCFRPGSKTLE